MNKNVWGLHLNSEVSEMVLSSIGKVPRPKKTSHRNYMILELPMRWLHDKIMMTSGMTCWPMRNGSGQCDEVLEVRQTLNWRCGAWEDVAWSRSSALWEANAVHGLLLRYGHVASIADNSNSSMQHPLQRRESRRWQPGQDSIAIIQSWKD